MEKNGWNVVFDSLHSENLVPYETDWEFISQITITSLLLFCLPVLVSLF